MNKLQKVRKDKKITQKELAKRTNIPLNTIIKYETNVRQLNKIDTLIKISKELNCKIQDLLDDEIIEDFNSLI